MNLESSAAAEKERRTRSKLEPHREAIFTLRRKHWSYADISKWLNEHGVPITLSSVQRFCERAVARRPRAATEPQFPQGASPSASPQPKSTEPRTQSAPSKHRFNLDI